MTSEESHSFLHHSTHHHSTEPDWPTSADLYAPSLHSNHHHSQYHHDTSALNGLSSVAAAASATSAVATAPPLFSDVSSEAPPSGVVSGSTGKRGGRKGSKTAALGASGSDNVEVIVCQGTATVIPKARSDVERRYICNGQPIHRVTFWRHRKHGCPHVIGEGGDGTAEGFMPAAQPRPKRAPRNSAKMDRLVAAAEKERELEHQQGANAAAADMGFGGVGYDMTHHFGVAAPLGSSLKFKPMGMGYSLSADGMVDVAASTSGSSSYSIQAGFDITPGSVPSQLDATSLGPQIPSFPGAPSQAAGPTQYGFIPRPPPSTSSSSSSHMMPPFSLLTDALNLYYAPYRSTELEDEEISSPIRTNYVNSSSPYQSDGRSEASDFMEDPHAAHHSSDGMFKNYLERNE